MDERGLTEERKQELLARRKKAFALHNEGKKDEALELYRELLPDFMGDAQIWNNIAVILREKRHYHAAAAANVRAVFADPKLARVNLANSLRDLSRFDDSMAAILFSQETAEQQSFGIGLELANQGRFFEALALYNRTLAKDPDRHSARLARAVAYLALGDLKRGFEDYEARFQEGTLKKPQVPSPYWDGKPMPDGHLVVINEQGFGDAIMMCRFLAMARQRVGRLTFVGRPPMRRLIGGLPFVDDFHDAKAKGSLGEDAHVMMMSLPRALGIDRATLPPAIPFPLPKEAVERARSLLAPYQRRFKVGIAWAGSPGYAHAAKKDIPLHHFIRLAETLDVQLVSVYKGASTALDDMGARGIIVDIGSTDSDFADTAAVIKELDLVITMDTAIVHLAGSMGVPTWLLAHRPCFWTWAGADESTIWYDSVRVLRQDRIDDWDGIFERVRQNLTYVVQKRRLK